MLGRTITAVGAATLLASGWILAVGCSSFSEADPGASDAGADGTTEDAEAYCSNQVDATFCADFEVPPLGAGWNRDPLLIEGRIELTDAGASSSSLHAALATTPPATGPAPEAGTVLSLDGGTNSVQSAVLLRDFAPGSTNGVITYEVDVRVDDLPPPGESQMVGAVGVSASSADGGADSTVIIAFGRHGSDDAMDGALTIDTGAGSSTDLFVPPKPMHEWFHVTIVADRSARYTSIRIDGVEVKRVPSTAAFDGRSAFRIAAGVIRQRGDGTTSVAFDNALLRAP